MCLCPPGICGLLEGRNEAVSRDVGVQGRKWRGIVTRGFCSRRAQPPGAYVGPTAAPGLTVLPLCSAQG